MRAGGEGDALGILGVNFWNDEVKTVGILTVDKKSAVMLRESRGTLDFAISDPTLLNTGSFNVEIARPAATTTLVSAG